MKMDVFASYNQMVYFQIQSINILENIYMKMQKFYKFVYSMKEFLMLQLTQQLFYLEIILKLQIVGKELN